MLDHNSSLPLSLLNVTHLDNLTLQINQSAIEQDLLVDILKTTFRYIIPVFIVVGVTGNVMVWILINSNRVLKSIPSNVYLLALALFSGLFLVFLALSWLDTYAQYFYYVRTSAVCKVFTYISHTCDFFEAVIIYAVLRTRARRHVFILVLFAFVSNSWIMFLATADGSRCNYLSTYPRLYAFFTYLEAVSCLIIPSLIITTLNVYIVLKLHWYIRENGAHLTNNQSVTFAAITRTESSDGPGRKVDKKITVPTIILHHIENNGIVYHSVPNFELQLPTNQPIVHGGVPRLSLHSILLPNSIPANQHSSTNSTQSNNNQTLQRPKIRRQELQLTKTLLIVTSAFVTLNLPGYLLRVLNTFFLPNIIFPGKRSYMLFLLMAYGLQYFHHAILFYLYIFYSPQMKKRLGPTALKLLECYCMKPVHDDME